MNLNSNVFIFIFLPIFVGLYWIVGLVKDTEKQLWIKKVLLLIFSVFLYFWIDSYYFIFVMILIVLNYVGGEIITHTKAKTPLFLFTGLDIGILAFFKIWEQGLINISFAPASIQARMPKGISFIVFALLAYLFDISKGRIKDHTNIAEFSLQQLFFSKIISGPINRYNDFYKKSNFSFELSSISEGIKKFIFGFFKKIIIADTIGITVDQIFALPASDRPLSIAWLSIFLFSLQIFYDFSGYTDMALGIARIFGVTLPENFDYPYISKSIREFWRRWHISLSNWFRDYVFFPLERSSRKLTFWPKFINVWIVFFLTGIWHGFSWNFLIWGMIHGVVISLENSFLGKILEKLPKFMQTIYAYLVVLFSWVFFRTQTLYEAKTYFRSMLHFENIYSELPLTAYTPIQGVTFLAITLAVIFLFPAPKFYFEKLKGKIELSSSQVLPQFFSVFVNLIVLAAFAFALIFSMGQTFSSFLYGNF